MNDMKSEDFGDLEAYFRAANFLTVGQIYLQDNALLREPLRRRSSQRSAHANLLMDECQVSLDEHHNYVRGHFEDMPEISGFRWPGA